MYFYCKIYKPILAFLPFGLRSARYGPAGRGAPAVYEDAPQTYLLDHSKSARGNRPKGMQKSDKKSAYIPYLDNIELKCPIRNFVKFINLVKITEFVVILGVLKTTQGACGLSSLLNSHEGRTHHA